MRRGGGEVEGLEDVNTVLQQIYNASKQDAHLGGYTSWATIRVKEDDPTRERIFQATQSMVEALEAVKKDESSSFVKALKGQTGNLKSETAIEMLNDIGIKGKLTTFVESYGSLYTKLMNKLKLTPQFQNTLNERYIQSPPPKPTDPAYANYPFHSIRDNLDNGMYEQALRRQAEQARRRQAEQAQAPTAGRRSSKTLRKLPTGLAVQRICAVVVRPIGKSTMRKRGGVDLGALKGKAAAAATKLGEATVAAVQKAAKTGENVVAATVPVAMGTINSAASAVKGAVSSAGEAAKILKRAEELVRTRGFGLEEALREAKAESTYGIRGSDI